MIKTQITTLTRSDIDELQEHLNEILLDIKTDNIIDIKFSATSNTFSAMIIHKKEINLNL